MRVGRVGQSEVAWLATPSIDRADGLLPGSPTIVLAGEEGASGEAVAVCEHAWIPSDRVGAGTLC